MKQTPAQQVINRLARRWEKARGLTVNCMLGRKPLGRRGGGCSVCRARQEFELDQAVAQLINAKVFRGTGVCPYQVVYSHLVAGLAFGPETFRAKSAGQYRVDPVVEIKEALERIGVIIRASGWSRDDIETLSNKNDWWEALGAVFSAEHDLQKALAIFRAQIPKKSSRWSRGRAGALHIQAIARTMANAWRVLTGHLPAKDNEKFHDLLLAAVATVFGHPEPEKAPNWESATRIAVKRIAKDAANRS
jgi:hypothetical protein